MENRCSRASQCQNSSKSLRWVQDVNSCITAIITPNSFVLDNPQTVSIPSHIYRWTVPRLGDRNKIHKQFEHYKPRGLSGVGQTKAVAAGQLQVKVAGRLQVTCRGWLAVGHLARSCWYKKITLTLLGFVSIAALCTRS